MTRARTAANQDARQRLIRLIHVARRELAMDEDTYRALLVQCTGQDTSARLSVAELDTVLAHMKRRGFKVRHTTRTSKRALAQSPQDKKIRALWLALHQQGAVRDPSEAALAAYVKRIAHVDALQWLNIEQASQIIETLKRWEKRIKRAAARHQESPA